MFLFYLHIKCSSIRSTLEDATLAVCVLFRLTGPSHDLVIKMNHQQLRTAYTKDKKKKQINEKRRKYNLLLL